MYRLSVFLFSVVLLLALNIPVMAVTFDEVIEMNEAGVSAEVVIALIETTESGFNLTTDDVILLEESGVPDDVILIMLEGFSAPEEEPAPYLKLSDEQFREMFFAQEIDTIPVSEASEPVREPSYYHSNPSPAPRQYVSYPSQSSYDDSYSNGYGYSYDYGYSSPGYYSRSKKVYRATYYPGTYYNSYYPQQYTYPNHYNYGGRGYYPTSYSRGYYPGNYYSSKRYRSCGNQGYHSGCRHDSSQYYYPGSRARYRSYNDNYSISLGFSF